MMIAPLLGASVIDGTCVGTGVPEGRNDGGVVKVGGKDVVGCDVGSMVGANVRPSLKGNPNLN